MKESLKPVKPDQKGLQKLPKEVRNKMGYMKNGGRVMKKDGGCAQIKGFGKARRPKKGKK